MPTKTELDLPRCPTCWRTDHVYQHDPREYRCTACRERFDAKGEKLHEWQFYANGSFCRRCGASIGSPYACR